MSTAVRRVLVLDDDRANALLQGRALERAGYSTVLTYSAEQAFTELSHSTPDIIVVDHQLRGDYTGIAFCANLRASGQRMPVVMVSASTDERIVIDALRVGVKDFILKDTRFFEALPRAVSRVLERIEVEAQVSGTDIGARPVSSSCVLIIESDPAEARQQEDQLKRTGYGVAVASGLASALALLHSTRIDLVVLDQRLANRETGLQVYSALQAAGYDIPAILVTAHRDRAVAAEALRAGIHEYVEKSDGYERQLATTAQQVLERTQLERQLVESRTRLASIISSARDAILTVNTSGTITLLNRSAADLFSSPVHSVVGKPLSQFLPGLQLTSSQPSVAGPESDPFEMECHGRDGTKRPVEVSISASEVAGGRFYTIIARDITARKQAEAELRSTNEALARANDDLQQFAYISSHDLQEPIRTVTAYTQLLERKLADKLDADARTYMRYVVSSAKHMSELISDTLQYARLSNKPLELSAVRVENLLSDVLHECDALIKQSGAVVTHDPLPEVNAQRTQLAIVLRNLITNAVKYKREDPPRIHVSAVRHASEWELQFRDNGIGFQPKYGEQIFRVFKRLHGAEIPGTGIGLALCKRIAENHGGRIWATSRPGEGSTFHFTIPIQQGNSEEADLAS